MSAAAAAVVPAPTALSDPDQFTNLGGYTYFFAATAPSTRGLWRTNGLPGGTVLVKDGFPTTDSNRPWHMAAAGGRLYFGAVAGEFAEEPWTSDGTTEGTILLKDVNPGAGFSRPEGFTEYNGRVYFAAYSPAGLELWSTDGTTAGTSMVVDPTPGGDTGVQDLRVIGPYLYFGTYGARWRTDGTAAGTVKFGDGVGSLTDVNGTLFYVASHLTGTVFEPWVYELWKTDGSAAGAVMLHSFQVNSQQNFRGPAELTNVNGTLFFRAVDDAAPTHVMGLWKSDGTAAGTVPVKERPSPEDNGTGLSPQYITNFDGRALFAGYDQTTGGELWMSDGTPDGTTLVAETAPGPSGGVQSAFYRSGNRVFFAGRSLTAGTEVFVSDTTEAGTALVADLLPGSGSGAVLTDTVPLKAIVAPNGRFLFAGRNSGADVGLWSTDGSGGGTFRLSGALSSVAARHVFYNNSAFDAHDAQAGPSDDGAIATDKAAVLPGQAITFAGVTGYSRGINGIMIDVAGGLPLTALAGVAAGAELKVSTGGGPGAWADAPRPAQVAIRTGAGVGGSDRLTLVWPDGTIRNAWLRVTLRASPQSGLVADDVFSFGNLAGESGDSNAPFTVSAADLLLTRGGRAAAIPAITNRADHNRDGVVNVLDYAIALRNLNQSLGGPPLPPAIGVASVSRLARAPTTPARRSLLTEDAPRTGLL